MLNSKRWQHSIKYSFAAEAAAGGLLTKETRQEMKTPRREEWAAVSGRLEGLAPAREKKKTEKAEHLVPREGEGCIHLGGGGSSMCMDARVAASSC